MNPVHVLWLSLGMLFSTAPGDEKPPPDLAQLREMLQDRQNPPAQSQAALLLVQSKSPEAEAAVRQALARTEAVESFQAVAAAVRLCRDNRYLHELFNALAGDRPTVREAAGDALAVLARGEALLHLQKLVENPQRSLEVRQAALKTLGRCGQKAAAVILLDQLTNEQEPIRKAAGDALENLTGQQFGADTGRWRAWWESHQNLSSEEWLEERLAFQASRADRLAGDLDRVRRQTVRLHQQLFARLPLADRLGYVQGLVDQEEPALRSLAVTWCGELWPAADAVGKRVLMDLLLQLSRDGELEVQRAAVLLLGRVNDACAFERLKALLKHGPPPARVAAARALTQQIKSDGPESAQRAREILPALQKALQDPSLEVVVEAAEDLGHLGSAEAGPVLRELLGHSSAPVRQAAAQALERVADAALLDGLLAALNDPAVTVRFSLVGALGHAAGDGRQVSEAQLSQLVERLLDLLVRDTDPGVRSRAATVLGECGPPTVLPHLWQRVQASEEARVQEKAWSALTAVVVRSNSLNLAAEWDRRLTELRQGARRLQLLTDVQAAWKKAPSANTTALSAVTELLVAAQIDQGKWAAALPLARDLVARADSPGERDKRLGWLLLIGRQALRDGNKTEALLAAQTAEPYLPGKSPLGVEFEALKRQAHGDR